MAKQPKNRALRWLVRLASVAAALALLLVAAVLGADSILCIDHSPEPSDAIIVLGGSPKRRPARAAELFHQGHAPLIIVTGAEDCVQNQNLLLSSGIPLESIVLECMASNTFQNATLTAPLLRERQVKRVLLVTDALHTRRALHTFQKLIPDVTFRVIAVRPAPHEWRPTRRQMAKRELLEYVKIAWYGIRYRIPIL